MPVSDLSSTPPVVAARDLYKRHFHAAPTHTVRAPGRLELLGNHTDYNEGLVMSLAVDKYTAIVSSPRKDGKIELVSAAFPAPEIFWADQPKKNPAAPWADYVKGVLEQLQKRGVHCGGFNAAIAGDIPMGAGMSSSASLEVATALTVRQLFPFALAGIGAREKKSDSASNSSLSDEEKLEIAKVCQAAENQFVGVRSGLLDQISSLFGKAWNTMSIDFRSLTVEHAPLTGEAIIICNSGVKHALVGGEYNELRDNCEGAARKLGAKTLRSVDLKEVEANKGKLTEREYQCAKHVTAEIARVVAGERALRNDDHAQFGQYMFQSHASSRDLLKNSAPELDMLVEIARGYSACLGARLTGGGFGGATINLVHHHQADEFMRYMAAQYKQKSGREMLPLVCQIVGGAA